MDGYSELGIRGFVACRESCPKRLFADHGFDGTSMRELAAQANAQLALIHYHFGSKLDVYRAIWASRYTSEVASRREVSLATVDYSEPRSKVIRTLVEIFLLPLFRMREWRA